MSVDFKCFSRAITFMLTEGWLRFRDLAAFVKLPFLATAKKALICDKSKTKNSFYKYTLIGNIYSVA